MRILRGWTMSRSVVRVGAVVALVGGLVAATAGPSSAATSSLTTPGTATFEVPANVCSIQVVTRGAAGGAGGPGIPNAFGGDGGSTTTTVAVTPFEVLQVNVGGLGGTGTDTVGGPGGIPTAVPRPARRPILVQLGAAAGVGPTCAEAATGWPIAL